MGEGSPNKIYGRAIIPRFHAGLDLTRLITGVFHPGLYGDNVCMIMYACLLYEYCDTKCLRQAIRCDLCIYLLS